MKRNSLKSQSKWHIKLVCLLIVFIFLTGVGILGFQYKSDSKYLFSKYVTDAKTWVSERKKNIEQKVSKKAASLSKDEPKKSVDFEFYTALPNMEEMSPKEKTG